MLDYSDAESRRIKKSHPIKGGNRLFSQADNGMLSTNVL